MQLRSRHYFVAHGYRVEKKQLYGRSAAALQWSPLRQRLPRQARPPDVVAQSRPLEVASISLSTGIRVSLRRYARVCLARFDGNNSSGAVDGNMPSMQCIAASFSDRCNLLPVPAIQWETRVHVFEKRYG